MQEDLIYDTIKNKHRESDQEYPYGITHPTATGQYECGEPVVPGPEH